MRDELDDTVLSPGRPLSGAAAEAAASAADAGDTDDTIIVHRPPLPGQALQQPLPPDGSRALIAASTTPTAPPELVEPPRRPAPAARVEPARVEPARTAGPPVLVEPALSPAAPPVQPPVLIPSVYRFLIAGTVVALDRIAYIGRKPTRPRIVRDGLARLVHVPSARTEVSATHLEIRQRGLAVVVTDLRSTNGSIVNIPGLPPRNLRQGESMVVTPGTLVDIGDGILIEILPMQHQ